MRNLIWLGLVLVFSACSVQGQPLPTVAPQAIRTDAPVGDIAASTVMVAPTSVPATAIVIDPTSVPTSASSSTPTTALTVIPTLTIPVAPTRAASSTGSGPSCNRMTGAPTVAEGALGSVTNPIGIGLVVYRERQLTAEAGAQLAECLSEINGLAYDVQVSTTARETVEALADGETQLAFLDVLAILLGQQEYGFKTGLVILRTEQETLEPFSHREFFANKTAGIQTLADVKGKTFCFGEPNNLFNTVLPQLVLAANGIDPETDLKAGTIAGFADTIAMAVYRGECDAGSGYTEILTFPGEALQTYPDLADKVETFYMTDPIPNDGIQYAQNMDAVLQEATTAALLKMAADNPGKHPPLVTLYKIEGFVRVGNEFYGEFGELVKRAGVDLESLVK